MKSTNYVTILMKGAA